MNRHALTVNFARTRGGRAVLHALCLARGRNWRWHLGGIVRELFHFGSERRRSNVATDGARGGSRPFCGLHLGLLLSCVAARGALGAGVGASATAAPTLHLLTVSHVDGTGVFLQQLATIEGLEPEAMAVPVRLGAAPRFGRVGVWTRDQIAAALAAARPDLGAVRWTGADSVRVVRRSRLLPESELRDLLAATLQRETVKDRGELELRLARPWTTVQVPDETLTLKILDLPSTGISPHFIVRFELVAGEEHLGPWQAVAQARLLRDILVAAAPMRHGQLLESSDFTVERRDILNLREPLDEAAVRAGALEVIDPVPVGQPILGRSVRPRPVVQRGMVVDGVVRDGALHIVLKVEVLADGLPGQQVRVRNPKTKREFYGKVKDEQTILINL